MHHADTCVWTACLNYPDAHDVVTHLIRPGRYRHSDYLAGRG
jgi:hypothetical protein